MMDTSVVLDDEDDVFEEEEEEDFEVMPVRKRTPIRKRKRIHRGKRMCIRASESDRSYLSHSQVLATGYKRKIRDLLIINKELAKRLEESELRNKELEKLPFKCWDSDVCRAINLKMNLVSEKLGCMATNLNECAQIVMEVMSFTKPMLSIAEDTTNLQLLNNNILPLFDRKEKFKSAVANAANCFILEGNENRYPTAQKDFEMSAIEEVSVVTTENTLKLTPAMLQNTNNEESGVAVSIEPEKSVECCSKINTARKDSGERSNRRSSTRLALQEICPSIRRNSNSASCKSITVTPIKTAPDPPSDETPKTPPIYYAGGKFKSNIPKSISVKRPDIISSPKLLTFLDNVNLKDSTNPKTIPEPKTEPEVASRKSLAKGKGRCSNSKVKRGSNRLEKIDTKKSSGRKNSKSGHDPTDIELGKQTVVPNEKDDSGLNLRRCTFVVTKDNLNKDKDQEHSGVINLPVVNPRRVTFVMPGPSVCTVGPALTTQVDNKACSPNMKKANILDTQSSINTQEIKISSNDKCSTTVVQHPAIQISDVTVYGPLDMSLTEVLPKDIFVYDAGKEPVLKACDAEMQLEPKVLHQDSVDIPEIIPADNIQASSKITGRHEGFPASVDEGVSDNRLCNVEVEKPANCAFPDAKLDEEKSLVIDIENDIIPSKVSLTRRKKKTSAKVIESEYPDKNKLNVFSNPVESSDNDPCSSSSKPTKSKIRNSTSRQKGIKKTSLAFKPFLDTKKSEFLSLQNTYKNSSVNIKVPETATEQGIQIYDFNDSECANLPLEADNKKKLDGKEKKQKLQTKKKKNESFDDDFVPCFVVGQNKKKKNCVLSSSDSDEECIATTRPKRTANLHAEKMLEQEQPCSPKNLQPEIEQNIVKENVEVNSPSPKKLKKSPESQLNRKRKGDNKNPSALIKPKHPVKKPKTVSGSEVNNEIKKDDKIEIQKDDKIELQKDDKIEIQKDDKIEIQKDDKIKIQKEDKLKIQKEDKIKIQKEDKIKIQKEDKIKIPKEDKIKIQKEDKVKIQKEDKIKIQKDDKIKIQKDDKPKENIEKEMKSHHLSSCLDPLDKVPDVDQATQKHEDDNSEANRQKIEQTQAIQDHPPQIEVVRSSDKDDGVVHRSSSVTRCSRKMSSELETVGSRRSRKPICYKEPSRSSKLRRDF